MTNLVPGNEYRVVLLSVPEESIEAVADELTVLFPLERSHALQVAKNAPIILLEKLSSVQAGNVETYLPALRRHNADVQITSGNAGTAKKLNWPRLPHIVKHAGNSFICPHCGVRLQVMAEGVAQPKAAPTIEPTPVEPPAAPAEAATGGVALQDDKDNLPAEDSAAEQPEADEAAAPPAAATEEKADSGEGLLPSLGEYVEEEEHAAPDNSSDNAPLPLGTWSLVEDDEEMPEATQGGEAAAPAEPPPAPAAPAPKPAAVPPKPATPPAPPAEELQGEAFGGSIRVTVISTIKPVQRKSAAVLISKYLGVPIDEALKATSKKIVTVARNATPEQAEQCRKDFKVIGLAVQLTER